MNGIALPRLSDCGQSHGEVGFSTASRPIDLVHLSKQSLGDRQVERELLQLFRTQADHIMARLGSEIGAGDRRWRRDLAHTLRGSATAVGAHVVASCAAAYEEALFSSASDRELVVLRDNLSVAVGRARMTIGDLLSEA